MKKIIVVAVMALSLAGCETARQDRQAGGALIGGGAGALIGGLATNSVGGAVAGGLIGAASGAIIADATRPGRCYYYTRSGYRRYTRC
jgi:predicted small secreted protein